MSSNVRSKPAVSHEAAPEQRPSDPQEIDFLPRREGHGWSRDRIADHVRHTGAAIAEAESEGAVRKWNVGNNLLELYNGFAEQARPGTTFAQFVLQTFGLNRDDLYLALRIRHRATRDEARHWGESALILGFRLMDRLGLETFDALRRHDLPQPDDTTTRFPAPRERLRAALKMLQAAPAIAPPRKVRAETDRRNEIFRLARAEDPTLAEVQARWIAGEREPELRVSSALGRAHRVALAKIILTLDR